MFVYPQSPGEDDLLNLNLRLGTWPTIDWLLLQALTHPSWAEQDTLTGHTPPCRSQESLVNLGARRLEEVITQCLRRAHPKATESGLWRVAASYTRGTWLSQCARILGLDDLMRVGSSAQNLPSYDTEPIQRTLKAVLGAMHTMDQHEALERLISTWFVTYTPPTHEIRTSQSFSNHMGAVHELLCGWRSDKRWTCRVEKLGPDHYPTWRLTYDLTAIGLGIYVGSGRRLQHAKYFAYNDIFRDAVLYGLLY